MDRIAHAEIEGFKQRVYDREVNGMTVGQWNRLFSSGDDVDIKHALRANIDIREGGADELLL